MMMNTHNYNLKAVIRMTGLSADTLRAWERRYHLPQPERTSGGQRIYSRRDIAILQWLIAKQTEGVSISNAVSLWNEQLEAGLDPLQSSPSAVAAHTEPSSNVITDNSLVSLKEQWKQACLGFNEDLANQVVNHAFAISAPEVACHEIFVKGLSELGQGWLQAEVSVQQEHFASGIALHRLGSLISLSPPASRKETILVCCPPGEEHSLSTAYLSFLLRRYGYRVIELGAKTPLEQLKETVLKVKPQLVILSAQQLVHAVHLQRSARALAQTVPVGFGGRIFTINPSLVQRIPAFYLGDSLTEVPGRIENIIHRQAGWSIDESENPYAELHDLFEHTLRTLYSLVSISKSNWDVSDGSLSAATHMLNHAISAALFFGDLDLLQPEMHWVEDFLGNRRFDRDQVTAFLRRYLESIDRTLGQEAAPLTQWFKNHHPQIVPPENTLILS
jgi:DNA-binding transcriptional MerR regulator